jgi:hypothetical protein
MSFNVRVFGFRGIQQMKNFNPKQFSADSVYQLVHPYEWAQLLLVNGGTPVASAPLTGGRYDQVTILRVEVPDGQSIRYEINPPTREGGVVAAGNGSQIHSGNDEFYFNPGWTISMVDAASFL